MIVDVCTDDCPGAVLDKPHVHLPPAAATMPDPSPAEKPKSWAASVAEHFPLPPSAEVKRWVLCIPSLEPTTNGRINPTHKEHGYCVHYEVEESGRLERFVRELQSRLAMPHFDTGETIMQIAVKYGVKL